MTDDTGAIVWKATYKPFGEAEASSNSTVANNLRFPGQYFDEESRLHYNYHRYYDPGIARYARPDPIGHGGRDLSLYTYVQNDPTSYVDPFGLIRWSGTSFQVSVIGLVGATFNLFKLESECVNGKKALIKIWAVGPSVGLGAKGTFTVSKVRFEDYADTIATDKFNGVFMLAQAGITFHPGLPVRPPGKSIPPGAGPGVGVAASTIRLGGAFSGPINFGLAYGFDKSISGTIGSSTVIDSRAVYCHEEEDR